MRGSESEARGGVADRSFEPRGFEPRRRLVVVRELTEAEARGSSVGSSIDGPWYVTRTAVAQYARIFFGGTQEAALSEAKRELIEVCKGAHRVRVHRPGVVVWRASPEWHRTMLLVADGKPGMLPSLIAVRPPYKGWRPE